MVMNKRIPREKIAETFDAFDVFARGELKAGECTDVAATFHHFLDCNPSSIFALAEFSGAPTIKRDACVAAIYAHIVGTATPNEANAFYDVFTSDTPNGPQDSVDVVGSRFGPTAKFGSHPDGQKLDPLLVSLASRVTGERTTSKRVADAALFVQNATSVLFPGRKSEEALHREEYQDMSLASNRLHPSANKMIWKSLYAYAATGGTATGATPPDSRGPSVDGDEP